MHILAKFITIFYLCTAMTGCGHFSTVRFAAIGDTPYYASESELAQFSESLQHIASKQIPFVIHVGDIFRGYTDCAPELYERRAHAFSSSPIPFLVTIGDNEFNDCFDPIEAQENFRKIILRHPPLKQMITGTNTVSETLHLSRQETMIENAAWTFNNVLFVMFVFPDMPGNFPLSPEQISEIISADEDFLVTNFNKAIQQKSDALVMITHSEPALCTIDGCAEFNQKIISLVEEFKKPVLLINGSNHSRTFKDGGYQDIPYWWHLRPGSTPEEVWPEIMYSNKRQAFSVNWIVNPSQE